MPQWYQRLQRHIFPLFLAGAIASCGHNAGLESDDKDPYARISHLLKETEKECEFDNPAPSLETKISCLDTFKGRMEHTAGYFGIEISSDTGHDFLSLSFSEEENKPSGFLLNSQKTQYRIQGIESAISGIDGLSIEVTTPLSWSLYEDVYANGLQLPARAGAVACEDRVTLEKSTVGGTRYSTQFFLGNQMMLYNGRERPLHAYAVDIIAEGYARVVDAIYTALGRARKEVRLTPLTSRISERQARG